LSAKDYRAKRQLTFKVPSGLDWTIRKIPFRIMWKMLEILGIEVPEGMTEEDAREYVKKELKGKKITPKVVEIVNLVVPAISLKPKVVIGVATDDDELGIDDIDMEDLMAVFGKGMEISGATEDAVKERESFQPESPRKIGG